MGYLWDFYGISMGFLWDIHGISMGYLWDIHGISMGFLWDSVWILYGLVRDVGFSARRCCLDGLPRWLGAWDAEEVRHWSTLCTVHLAAWQCLDLHEMISTVHEMWVNFG